MDKIILGVVAAICWKCTACDLIVCSESDQLNFHSSTVPIRIFPIKTAWTVEMRGTDCCGSALVVKSWTPFILNVIRI